jgi:hypothetical protein
MGLNDLHIEKLNLDVLAPSHQGNYQAFMQQITNEIQHNVLSKIEADLEMSPLKLGASDVFIDKLNLDLSGLLEENWQDALSDKVVQQITKVLEEQQHQQELFRNSNVDALNFWYQIRYFYRWGVFPFGNDQDDALTLQIWESKLQKSDFYLDILEKSRRLLQADQTHLKRILNQHSKSYLSDLINPLFTVIESDFLFECLEFNPLGFQFASDFLKICFSSLELKSAETKSIFYQLGKTEFVGKDFLNDLSINEPTFYKKHQNLIQKSFNLSTPNELTDLLKLKCSTELFSFIAFLREDTRLREKLDAHLQNYFEGNSNLEDVSTWIKNFIRFIPRIKTLSNLVVDLNDTQTSKRAGFKNYSDALHSLISALEKKQEIREVEQEEPFEKKDPTHFLAPNAGLVLLNPFFPTLFKNLGIQSEKGKWASDHAQAVAIYLLNYLATNKLETTEEQLILCKLLTGFPIKEPLDTWEQLCQQSPTIDFEKELIRKLEEVELPNLLEIIHQNWYPMRNCTWPGLRNDFLARTGKLELEENKQPILTINKNALDVLLPHIKWGISMIKYSWMEDVLNVEWG